MKILLYHISSIILLMMFGVTNGSVDEEVSIQILTDPDKLAIKLFQISIDLLIYDLFIHFFIYYLYNLYILLYVLFIYFLYECLLYINLYDRNKLLLTYRHNLFHPLTAKPPLLHQLINYRFEEIF